MSTAEYFEFVSIRIFGEIVCIIAMQVFNLRYLNLAANQTFIKHLITYETCAAHVGHEYAWP